MLIFKKGQKLSMKKGAETICATLNQKDTIIMLNFLDEVQLNKVAPSIFAKQESDFVSDKYKFIPTIEILRGLKTSGFHPVLAMQSRTRLENRKNFAKHIVRFRHESAKIELGGIIPEIVLVNSHDGSSSYQLRAGVYRLICANGMIVGDETFCTRIHHKGNVVEKVVEAANELIEVVPISVRTAIEWQGIELKKEQREVFAQVAATMKWEEDNLPVSTQNLLTPRRQADKGTDLWTTFNVIQENMLRGGIRYLTDDGARQRTREVGSVGENVRLNTALWSLTEKMAQLAK